MTRNPLIKTIKERCRVCYTCVRECPAKAIRISGGQAEVIQERCIGCGNCVKVCSQNAKEVLSGIPNTLALLDSKEPIAAIVAPSFPVEFGAWPYQQLVGTLKALGFHYVTEVAYGADLVAQAYRQLLDDNPGRQYIATSCPAIVTYVEKYFPDLVQFLAPLVSPMIASARVLRSLHGSRLKIVFIGPCIAKKGEACLTAAPDEVDAVLTFIELREIFKMRLNPDLKIVESDFDPPQAGLGRLFPIARGLLESAGIKEDLIAGDIVATDGRENCVEAIREFDKKALNARLLELLCCHGGCIMGAGISEKLPLFQRRSMVSKYTHLRLKNTDGKGTEKAGAVEIDLSRTFQNRDQRLVTPEENDITAILKRMGKNKPEDELNCGACGYDTCREHAIAIHKNLAESEMCLPYTIERLKKSITDLNESNKLLAHTKHDLHESHEILANTKQALSNAEKLASMGQLSAGIAHEINNPLGVILLYANLLLESCPAGSEQFEDLKMISDQAERCKKIVSGLLNFARKNKVILQETNLHDLIHNCLKTITVPEKVHITLNCGLEQPLVEIDPDQIIQVLTNLIENAIEAMPKGGKITIATADREENIELSVADNGSGIPPENIKKIFEPLFTTKQIGMGTGLGLAVTYGIIKMHRGNIEVQTNTNPKKGPRGTTFIVTLPRKGSPELIQELESIGEPEII